MRDSEAGCRAQTAPCTQVQVNRNKVQVVLLETALGGAHCCFIPGHLRWPIRLETFEGKRYEHPIASECRFGQPS
jgi:hypothetical protein